MSEDAGLYRLAMASHTATFFWSATEKPLPVVMLGQVADEDGKATIG